MISKIQNLNNLKGGLDKKWPLRKNNKNELKCDILQKIAYTINDLNMQLNSIDNWNRKDIVYVIMLCTWIQEATKALFECYPEDLKSNFKYEKENELNIARKYLEAIRSFACAHPLKTNKHEKYGFNGNLICVDIVIDSKMASLFSFKKIGYIDFEGIHREDKTKNNFYLSCYSKENQKKMEFSFYIGCNYSDIYKTVSLFIDKIVCFDNYLAKLKCKEFLKYE